MAIYQKGLESKQSTLARFVDIGTELFAISATCSYASDNKASIELADLFCQESRARIEGKFRELGSNQDKLKRKIAKKVLAGEYLWLENDIMGV
jgi:hypothetical protein